MDSVEISMKAENPACRGELQNGDAEEQIRASYYLLLSRLLYSPPSAETLQTVSQFAVPEQHATNNFLLSLNDMAVAASEFNDLEQLDDEYHDLFIGVGRGEVLPYGSWYITGMLMDKPLSLLRQDLQALGIERDSEKKEPEDHIAAEMDVMGILIQAGEEFQFKTQQTFFTRHLKPWARRFFKDLEVARKAKFYKKVGKFGIRFIDFETEYLSMPT